MAQKKRHKSKPKSANATPNTVERPGHLLAPAPGNVLVGVVVLALGGFWFAATFRNDYLAVAICTVVMIAAWMILEYTGRAEARRHPNSLYVPNRLPTDEGKTRKIATVLTVAALVLWIAITAEPGDRPSAFPFFVAAGFLFLLLPQLLARKVVRRGRKSVQATPWPR